MHGFAEELQRTNIATQQRTDDKQTNDQRLY